MILGDKKVAPLFLRNYIFRAPALCCSRVSQRANRQPCLCAVSPAKRLWSQKEASANCVYPPRTSGKSHANSCDTYKRRQTEAADKKFCFGFWRSAQCFLASPFIFIELNLIQSIDQETHNFVPASCWISPKHKLDDLYSVILLFFFHASFVSKYGI
jgi:hypothetical protein